VPKKPTPKLKSDPELDRMLADLQAMLGRDVSAHAVQRSLRLDSIDDAFTAQQLERCGVPYTQPSEE
jgi:hypothetical protein